LAENPAAAITVVAVLPPQRPAFVADQEPVRTGALRDPQPTLQPEPQQAPPEQPRSLFGALFGVTGQPAPAVPAEAMIHTGRDFLDQRIAYHAKLNGVPAALVHRVVVRESRYNPRAVGRGGAMGLMQIKHATARGVGYEGSVSGLLDAETNLTYAVKYLAGAYRLADGSYDRAVQHYARGYYYEAKRRGSRAALRQRNERLQRQADATATVETAPAPATPRSLFGPSR
jgi:soluble lytic murein transglycosylase-like protein